MKLPLTGGCQCGALRYEISAAPLSTYTCHCTDCQHLTGSAFSMAIVVPDSAFRLTQGEPRLLDRIAESGRVTTRWVCPDCGSWIVGSAQPGSTVPGIDPGIDLGTVPGTIPGTVPGAVPGAIRRVRAGTLDDRSWLRPTAHFWIRSKQPWVSLPAGDQVYDTQPH